MKYFVQLFLTCHFKKTSATPETFEMIYIRSKVTPVLASTKDTKHEFDAKNIIPYVQFIERNDINYNFTDFSWIEVTRTNAGMLIK